MTFESARPTSATGGILLFSLGVFLFALNDALGKWLVADYGVGQLLLVRSLGAALVLLPLAWWSPVSLRLPDQWGLHALRIALLAADSFCFYFATKHMPLADVMTFYLAAPLIITALSGPMLGETIGRFRWGAVAVGFLGVLIVLHPTGASLSVAAPLALVGSVAFALAITITRKLRDTHWLPLVAWQFLGAGLVGGVTGTANWIRPSLFDFGLMLVVGFISMTCFACITRALRLADASVIAPFQYVSIVWAAILGWLIWGDIPTASTGLGIAVIVGSGLAVWWHELRRRNPKTTPAP